MYIDLVRIGKNYCVGKHKSRNAISNLSLSISENEIVTVLGQSGCGKSTLLKIIAGIEKPDAGQAYFRGQPITGIAMERGYIYQDYSLFPWLTVRQNIGFGLRNKNIPKHQKKVLIEEYLEKFGLKGAEQLYPRQLSGGMKQRTAIARSFCLKPDLLLLDEPFSALDMMNRHKLQDELLEILKGEKITYVMVTHDIEEAIYLSDRIIVMTPSPGAIQAIIPVSMPRPRTRTSSEFLTMREEIADMFYSKSI
ncbi:NitT/TauT family transport system ATP-binding protein [Paenibacillus cellulosilyticus]|uniref:NitT/TauT family transport system ATP-binding protein n=1 Tax=Paenibacillus cellulosilyticus TaxID=375489 RepID=A0A2V2YN14_9BACL|nr:ABC transporter ATP-binding protein [Paenibacillus cellulosilyticus]PWV95913.1 NitT/TauT family transport system ATP-binding protein [Paenibacillus cellulosilyticus]